MKPKPIVTHAHLDARLGTLKTKNIFGKRFYPFRCYYYGMSVLPNRVKALLDRKRCKMVKSLDIRHGLLDDLLSNGVLLERHYETIKACRTDSEQIEELLDILKLRSYDDFHKFVDVLRATQPEISLMLVEIVNDN